MPIDACNSTLDTKLPTLDEQTETASSLSSSTDLDVRNQLQAYANVVRREGRRLILQVNGRIEANGRSTPERCGAADICRAIKYQSAGALVFEIRSEGGDVRAFESIDQAIRAFRGTSVAIIDIAASSAALLALRCDRVFIRKSGRMMIHRSRAAAFGTRDHMRLRAMELGMIDARWLKLIIRRVGSKHEREIVDCFEEERWLGSADAIRLGLADAIFPDSLARDYGNEDANA
jgi:ATP-dependent protease ClpP protease subunit